MRNAMGWFTVSMGVLAMSAQEHYVPSTEQLVVELFVRDLDRSIAFYRDLGFEFIRRDDEFAELAWESHLFFLDASQPAPELSSPAANVRIMVPDVDAHWQKAKKAGVRVLRPIDDRYYGLRDFTVLDPVRPVEAHRHRHQATAEYLAGVESADEKIQHRLEAHLAAGGRRRVVDAQAGDVHMLVALVQGQEQVVHPR